MPEPAVAGGARIFISYSRRNAESFARELRDQLSDAGFAVWWDQQSMASRGDTFLDEIQKAIIAAHRLVLIVSPRVRTSPYVGWEWGLAERECVVVNPVLYDGPDEPCVFEAHCPPELRQYDAVDFRSGQDPAASLSRLLRLLAAAPVPLGTLHRVPELPPAWVPRDAALQAVAQLVHPDRTEPAVIASALRASALHGMGGIGKSTLAADFARRCGTRRFFPDGILWTAVGRTPELGALCREIGSALGEAAVASELTPAGALASLSRALLQRRCLLVFNDVWEPEHIRPFIDMQTGSRLLITTRTASLARSTGAREHQLDILEPAEALEVLRSWSSPEEHAAAWASPPEAAPIVNECGRLPLALAMIGSMVRAGEVGWTEALARLRARQLGDIRDRLPAYDHPDLLRAIAVSVDALSDFERARYLELCVFPEECGDPAGRDAALLVGVLQCDRREPPLHRLRRPVAGPPRQCGHPAA